MQSRLLTSSKLFIKLYAMNTKNKELQMNRNQNNTVCPGTGDIMLKLPKDETGMLTGDELRKMYAEKLLEKNSWDDALFKICWRSFLAGVNTSSSVLLEIKRLSADLPDCPLKEFIDKKIVEIEVEDAK